MKTWTATFFSLVYLTSCAYQQGVLYQPSKPHKKNHSQKIELPIQKATPSPSSSPSADANEIAGKMLHSVPQ